MVKSAIWSQSARGFFVAGDEISSDEEEEYEGGETWSETLQWPDMQAAITVSLDGLPPPPPPACCTDH